MNPTASIETDLKPAAHTTDSNCVFDFGSKHKGNLVNEANKNGNLSTKEKFSNNSVQDGSKIDA